MAWPRCLPPARGSRSTARSPATAAIRARNNAVFDRMLRMQDPGFGVRDLRDLARIATDGGMALEEEIPMPSNNHTLIWRKSTE